MSENERLDVLANSIKEVLIGHRMNDMPPLESEEDAAQRQQDSTKAARTRIKNINSTTCDY